MAIREKTGLVVSVHVVPLLSEITTATGEKMLECDPGLNLITVSTQGMLTRMPVSQIRRVSRNSQGVKVMNLRESEKVVSSHLTHSEE